MSELKGGILEIPASYNFKRDQSLNYRVKSIDPQSFHVWHQNNMYRSTYAQHHSNKSTEPKNSAIPGYGGYIPYVKAENQYAKGYTALSKDCLNRQALGKNTTGLTTSGFNVQQNAFIDDSKLGSTSKYGKSALQKPHPGWNDSQWKPTTRDTYQSPNSRLCPTLRPTDKFLELNKPSTMSSGSATNHAYLDGFGWNPLPILRGDNHRSQYRDRFNAKVEFHRNPNVIKERRLPHHESNYLYN